YALGLDAGEGALLPALVAAELQVRLLHRDLLRDETGIAAAGDAGLLVDVVRLDLAALDHGGERLGALAAARVLDRAHVDVGGEAALGAVLLDGGAEAASVGRGGLAAGDGGAGEGNEE